jgi:hypothetical protein
MFQVKVKPNSIDKAGKKFVENFRKIVSLFRLRGIIILNVKLFAFFSWDKNEDYSKSARVSQVLEKQSNREEE